MIYQDSNPSNLEKYESPQEYTRGRISSLISGNLDFILLRVDNSTHLYWII